MSRALAFVFERTARDGGRIRLGGRLVGEVRRLALVHFAPVPGAPSLVGRAVGVPLYWRQYANHQDPERRLDARRRLGEPVTGPGWLRLRASGATRSGAARGEFELTWRAAAGGRVTLEVRAQLVIPPGPGWRVTPQADHGELAFLTLWPAGVFSPAGRAAKRFQACLVQRGRRVEAIAHHHLESPDKQRLRLGPGDRFAWVREAWNPVVTIGAGTRAEAGVCAYMWDTHFGLRVCRGAAVVLPPGTVRTAGYTLGVLDRAEAGRLERRAVRRSPGAAADTPVYTGGSHDFRATFRQAGLDGNRAWPWQRAVGRGDPAGVAFARDTRVGRGDRYSLRLTHRTAARASWQATTLGPAFGEPAFRRGQRLRLTAQVRLRGVDGRVRVALRVHRTGRGSVFDASTYELFPSAARRGPDQDWVELRVETPPLSPAPDRVHLLLELDGTGRAWFDDVRLERCRRP